MEFIRLVKLHFMFLLNKGYKCDIKNACSIRYVDKKIIIEVTYSRIEYEINIMLYSNDETCHIYLQEIMNYFNSNIKGTYQLNNISSMESGIKYMAESLKICINYLENSTCTIKEIYDSVEKERKKLLKKYYIAQDTNKADEFWKTGKYEEAYDIYKKNEQYLSLLQKRRVEYIVKLMNSNK